MPMGNELKWVIKAGVGHIFERSISLENMLTSHKASLVLFTYACTYSAMPLLSFPCLCSTAMVTAFICLFLLLHIFSGALFS